MPYAVCCRHEHACVKSRLKRSVFDSARARAKGTDVEFFFPTMDWERLRRNVEPRNTHANWRQQSVYCIGIASHCIACNSIV
jgi:hypothetical protein